MECDDLFGSIIENNIENSYENSMKKADEALYSAKGHGRNMVKINY